VTWKNAGVRDGRRTLLLWDIDHTLIENAGVSKENYALAFEILTGRAPARTARTDGRTDVVIMSDLLSLNEMRPFNEYELSEVIERIQRLSPVLADITLIAGWTGLRWGELRAPGRGPTGDSFASLLGGALADRGWKGQDHKKAVGTENTPG
jgi:hypothetical protein